MSRAIVHLDADAFFAAVEQAGDPKLRGKPIAVGGERRGIIASASYEARKFGVYTPMPTVRARKLCPKLIVLPGDFERYEQFSNWLFGYCYDFTPDVEQTSIDEGYFDLSAVPKQPVTVAETIRTAIRQARHSVILVPLRRTGNRCMPLVIAFSSSSVRSTHMSDNKDLRHSQDNRSIDVNDRNEMRNWMKSLNVTEDELRRAVEKVGTSADKVREHLRTRH